MLGSDVSLLTIVYDIESFQRDQRQRTATSLWPIYEMLPRDTKSFVYLRLTDNPFKTDVSERF